VWVPRRAGEAFGGRVGEAEVEDAVHHPGHRDRSAGANREEQRVLGRPERLARLRLEAVHRGVELPGETPWKAATLHMGAARVRRDGESSRHRQAHSRHLGEAGSLAAQCAAPTGRVLLEVEHIPRADSRERHPESFRCGDVLARIVRE
jgi:hypothetical protein